MKRYHDAVLVKANGREAIIDKKLVKMVRMMWELGIDTAMSCESNVNGRVWLFLHVSDFDKLIDILFTKRNPVKRTMITGIGDKEQDNAWYLAPIWEEGRKRGTHISFRFPQVDVERIEKKLASAIRKQKKLAKEKRTW